MVDHPFHAPPGRADPARDRAHADRPLPERAADRRRRGARGRRPALSTCSSTSPRRSRRSSQPPPPAPPAHGRHRGGAAPPRPPPAPPPPPARALGAGRVPRRRLRRRHAARRAPSSPGPPPSFGNDISTLPDFPAEIRAPAGTLPGVSGFQISFSSSDIHTPGDQPDVLVAMNPAALKTNLGDLPPGGVLIVNRTPSRSRTSTRPATRRTR